MKELFSIPKPPIPKDFMDKPIEMSNNIDDTATSNKSTEQPEKEAK